jgi:hypothetical protein
MWSDPNLSPFMAVTAHWVEKVPVKSSRGGPPRLKLQVDLIGFIRVPGRHSGSHLSIAFIHVLDRIHVTHKV